MFQFRRFPSYTYFIQYMMIKVCLIGLLHSEICGSMCTYHSPQLIAVNHVLHRLLMPRHSPCALCSLYLSLLELSRSLKTVVIPDLIWKSKLLLVFSSCRFTRSFQFINFFDFLFDISNDLSNKIYKFDRICYLFCFQVSLFLFSQKQVSEIKNF